MTGEEQLLLGALRRAEAERQDLEHRVTGLRDQLRLAGAALHERLTKKQARAILDENADLRRMNTILLARNEALARSQRSTVRELPARDVTDGAILIGSPMDLIVQDVPQSVLRKLVTDAKRRDVSLVEAAVGILADQYGVTREPTGVGFRGEPTRATLLLAMPDDLHLAIKMAAARQKGVTMRGLIIDALAAHYGVKAAASQRRARGTATPV